ncbi:hypothetical protein IPL85_01130 [Candidatus Saccharibacteria bacterium]|nr:MAG: hypothetical protein IPL85_01130 [Candidatus Saccharibacteria bacterium]
MAYKKTRRRLVVTFTVLLLSVIVVAAGAFVLKQMAESRTVISQQILDQADFIIFYPGDTTKLDTVWQLQKDRTSYDKESGVLTLHALQASTGRQVVLNEQPTPGAFADVPTQYSRMLNTLNEYDELQIGFGTVALTRPKELNGGQSAVANKAGTLIFAKPSVNFTNEEWRDFFDSLRILR